MERGPWGQYGPVGGRPGSRVQGPRVRSVRTGRWTLDEANEQGVPVDLIERSLEIRAESRQTGENYATKVVAMLRNQFGGHELGKK